MYSFGIGGGFSEDGDADNQPCAPLLPQRGLGWWLPFPVSVSSHFSLGGAYWEGPPGDTLWLLCQGQRLVPLFQEVFPDDHGLMNSTFKLLEVRVQPVWLWVLSWPAPSGL